MNSVIVVVICTVFLYSSTQAFDCGANNPCDQTGDFTAANGYQCIPKDTANVYCTCPTGFEENRRCRVCDRTNPLQNACSNSTGRLIICLGDTSYGGSYACLCSDGFGGQVLTRDPNCNTDPAVTLTSRPPTTTATPGSSSQCVNGGVFVNGYCQCPSGYSGTICGVQNVADLCAGVVCLNNGTCAVRNPHGPYEAVCLCRYGTWGDYCELTGTLGFCSSSSCMNGGACKENVIGTTRHAYCRCPAGYNGPKCENRYFTCDSVGKYVDQPMFTQGKYFECTNVGGTLRIEQKSCPKGLRFNANILVCTY